MEIQTVSHSSTDEQTVIAIMRRLPPNRKEQMVSFARFLEYDTFNESLPKTSVSQAAKPSSEKETVSADDARWEALLATDDSQNLLDKLADEVLAEIQAGRAKPMVFTEDGEIAPGLY